MTSVSSMNNTCCMNIRSHAPLSTRDHHNQQLCYGTLKFKGLGRHSRKKRFAASRIVAEKLDIDFSDPDWKARYQQDFESRFSLPHLKDVLDVKPRPTTFSLMQSFTRINLFTFLKVIKFVSPNSAGAECIDPNCTWVHRVGPRKEIYFEPNKVKAAIVTSGGLCPGLNGVIRQLSREQVQDINLEGGSLLGVSHGGASMNDIAKEIDMVFVLGGNGTHARASAIHNE
ncbi:ATP-dependent 6-phosphofructokinase 5 chloroplastic, partial [Bienertia sinuspersici]